MKVGSILKTYLGITVQTATNLTAKNSLLSTELGQLITAYQFSQAIYVVTKLGIPDLLKDGPKNSKDLALSTGANADNLYRVMRALTVIKVFDEDEQGRFGLTHLGDSLRKDAPDSEHYAPLIHCEELYRSFGELLNSVRFGKPAFELAYGANLFQHLEKHPARAKIWDTFFSRGDVSFKVADAYDFSSHSRVVDVGGGRGHVLASILRKNRALKGVLFDRAPVVEGAKAFLDSAGVRDRCEIVGGSFFDFVPEGGDIYILSQIIHDWDDQLCNTILNKVRKAMRDNGKLLIVDGVVLPGHKSPAVIRADLNILAIGGKERTSEEFRSLLSSAGFRMTRVLPLDERWSIVEAVPI